MSMFIEMSTPAEYRLSEIAKAHPVIRQWDAAGWSWTRMLDIETTLGWGIEEILATWMGRTPTEMALIGFEGGKRFDHASYEWIMKTVHRYRNDAEWLGGMLFPKGITKLILRDWKNAVEEADSVARVLENPATGWIQRRLPKSVLEGFFDVAWGTRAFMIPVASIQVAEEPRDTFLINRHYYEVLMPGSKTFQHMLEGYNNPYVAIGNGIGDSGEVHPVMVQRKPVDEEN